MSFTPEWLASLGAIALFSIPYMAWLSRMSGGGEPKLPWGLDQWLLSLPYLIFIPQVGYWIVPAYLSAVLGLRLGHGRGFHYKIPFEPGSEPERVEAVIPDSWPVYWQKFSIMALNGLAVTLMLAIVTLCHGYVLSGLILALSGALKSLAYMTRKTEDSEYLRGAFLGLGLLLAYLLI